MTTLTTLVDEQGTAMSEHTLCAEHATAENVTEYQTGGIAVDCTENDEIACVICGARGYDGDNPIIRFIRHAAYVEPWYAYESLIRYQKKLPWRIWDGINDLTDLVDGFDAEEYDTAPIPGGLPRGVAYPRDSRVVAEAIEILSHEVDDSEIDVTGADI